ncbi:hypothetical protein MUN81_10665 [Hymenobacter sp. 5317J-9]|uniref:hypothetical protein n=1 Tax=Hymenobacter sp. 5317J-9 TaxID=2932250 RepID=UPI001FD64799|nr:hypothetical protein [Hymenobacter sp. 5317J-9]UOQ99941.1 hypothetical protein MUN81_10665 [Hymenobacter sp. 5317J-9]
MQVLARPTALGQAEVRELEQLAQAFPYCQTAHLLLAKAAHDQGTMLAGQRLRRAATYAADRALLRRLIEEVEPAPVPEAVPEIAAPAEETVTSSAPLPTAEPVTAEPPVAQVPAEPVVVPATPPLPAAEITVVEPPATPIPTATPVAEEASTAEAKPTDAAITVPETAPAVSEPEPVLEPVPETVPEQIADIPAGEEPAPTPVEALAEPEPDAEPEASPTPSAAVEADLTPVLVDQEGVDIPAASPTPEMETPIELAEEPDLPAQAPAIRPPVEVGEARFEFGLAEPPPPPPAYELPGLVDEWAAAAVTLSLGGPAVPADFLSVGSRSTPEAPELTPAAFTGDEAVGYGYGESSRLGFSLQLLNLLTDKAEANENTSPAGADGQPPATPLPPVGAFFEPDPLLLDYWATHRPPTPALPSSLDLINNFLKRQPRLTRPAMLPPSPTTQADLSVRSTRAEPDLVSESLARIFVRQGKTARAIEIYEKLMVKQPEKMAYFAAQIQSLQPSA